MALCRARASRTRRRWGRNTPPPLCGGTGGRDGGFPRSRTPPALPETPQPGTDPESSPRHR
eukprot:5714720-Alexandrium_andersonii.AAC.1